MARPDADAEEEGADDGSGRRRRYHHGNLREALVEAARKLIEEKGPLGFTMAEAARAADVSPAAPYRHFKGREDLLEAVALRGFELFARKLEEATRDGEKAPLKAFSAAGTAYLDFARNYPGYYMAMFESGVSIAGDPDLKLAADRAMGVLRVAAERLSAHLPPAKRPPAGMVANHIWALSHGVVELFTRGRLRSGPSLREAIEATDSLAGEARPDSYGINCSHPVEFLPALEPGSWMGRIRALRPNAAKMDKIALCKLNHIEEGDPEELGGMLGILARRHPQIDIWGGCCGTWERHIDAIARGVAAARAMSV